MAGHDQRVGQIVNLYEAILGSVPTELERKRNAAPLTEAEIPAAAAFMDQLGAEVAAERERRQPPGAG